MRKVGLDEGVEAPVGPEQQETREIPRSQFTRIRALVKHGMTVSSLLSWMVSVRFALDSLLEGDGFEPSVPQSRLHRVGLSDAGRCVRGSQRDRGLSARQDDRAGEPKCGLLT